MGQRLRHVEAGHHPIIRTIAFGKIIRPCARRWDPATGILRARVL